MHIHNIDNKSNYLRELNKKLFIASEEGNLDNVKELIQQGADIHADKQNSLISAAGKGHLHVVKYLLSQGADINQKNHFILATPSLEGHFEMVEYLIKEGAEINFSNVMPLSLAASEGHLNIVKLLVENGANIYAEDNTALYLSFSNGHTDVLKYLLEQSNNNDNNLIYAVSRGNLELVQLLIIEYGENPELALKESILKNQNEVSNWCQEYINSKELNEKLDTELDNKDIQKRKKI